MKERLDLVDAAAAHDGVAAFSEPFRRALQREAGHIYFERFEAETLVGLAALAPDGSAELAIAPDKRRRGHGAALVREVLERNPHAGLWAHGNLPAARGLAAALALEPTRTLYVMGLDGEGLDAATEVGDLGEFYALPYPQAVERFGKESVEQQWLQVNNEAFSWHPEQGGWDLGQLRDAMDTDWFDPHGVWFIYDGEKLAGFHWTKQHPGSVGEVYVVGLADGARGKNLGGPLLSLGVKHLVGGGARRVILYVESDNEPAVRRYQQMGFVVDESHVVYSAGDK